MIVRGMTSQSIGCCLLLCLPVMAVSGCWPDAFYEVMTDDPVVRLPLDEVPHSGGAEWWYYTGRLVTEDGHGYGVEASVFHISLAPFFVIADGWAAHFAVLDEATGAFVYEQTQRLGIPPFGGLRPGGFDLKTSLMQITGSDGQDRIQAAMEDGPYALDLTLEDERGPIVHEGNGYVPYGRNGRSFYYSRPRMRASGTLRVDGRSHDVSGTMWFDRQWGWSLITPGVRWDWFSLRLDDGTDVMLFAFRNTPEPVAFGWHIPDVGEPVWLSADDFVITPTAWWTSPRLAATYPVAWNIHVIPQDLTLAVTAAADDQELDVRASTFNTYWEGLCNLTGTHAGRPVTGLAYVELTGYRR